MIKIYGMGTCPDCTYLYDQIEGNDNYEYVDIGSHVRLMKEWLRLRDKESCFDEAKREGYAGLPAFVLEDGRVTLSPEEAGLKSRPVDQTPENAIACSIDGTGC